MRNGSLLAVAALVTFVLALPAAAPQAPLPPQAPPCREGFVCPCSQNGICVCTTTNDCGCIAGNLYRWRRTDKSNQTALYKGRDQVGNYFHDEGVFRVLTELPVGDRWQAAACPVATPQGRVGGFVATAPVAQAPAAVSVAQPAFTGFTGFTGVSSGGSCANGQCGSSSSGGRPTGRRR